MTEEGMEPRWIWWMDRWMGVDRVADGQIWMGVWVPDGSELKSGWVGRQTGGQTDRLGVKSITIDGEWDRKWHWASRWVGCLAS